MINKTSLIDKIFEDLAGECNERKRESLRIVREACQAQVGKINPTFSIAEIGRTSEAMGGVSARSIRTEPKKIYQKLISEFKKLYRTTEPVKLPKTSDEIITLIEKIEDNSLRFAMLEIYAKNKALTNENKQLKQIEALVVSKNGDLIQNKGASQSLLNDLEIRALTDFINPTSLKERNWSLSNEGQVIDESGRPITKRGFVDAVEKLVIVGDNLIGTIDD